MANRPIDDFDPRNNTPHDDAALHDEAQEPIDDEADFGGSHSRRAQTSTQHDEDQHDDADFVDDDMNDIVDDADPLADDGDDYGEDVGDHDDDADQHEDEPDGAAPAAPSRFGIGSIIFYVIMAGFVAGGGYMVYRTFMTGGEPVSPGAVLLAAGNAASDVKGVVVPTDSSAPVPAPLPADNSNPVPNPTRADASSGWQTTLPEEPAPAVQAVPLQQAQQAPMQPAMPVVTTATAPLAATAANTEAMTGLNARLAETESRLAQMTVSFATLTQDLKNSQVRVSQLEQRPLASAAPGSPVAITAPPAPGASTGVSAGDIASLRDENASLQKQITQLTRTQQALQTQVQSAPRTATTASPVAPVTKQIASPKVAKAAPQKVAPQPMVADSSDSGLSGDETPRSPKTRPQAAIAKPSWVLRAATPGMAWVSPQPGSAELKRVVPGDQLAGIGQITAIRQENGRWIVEGSNGAIR